MKIFISMQFYDKIIKQTDILKALRLNVEVKYAK